ncbi:class I SAM-dependent methyltransferase [Streptomyces sp. SBT349]|uniref:class I SAM-dependent methyltransferase n=1 Tax=Streptomyces sp. SBT349 TaxID=1580539 RepID=UPI0007C7DB80|nr:class I SAM-dependent methyltransferase [Streptomyces sp. SBT349]
MVDRQFSDAALTALYDPMAAGRRDFGFYLPLVMAARSVLDVGCGTGELLRLARESGHSGRLCGLDPAGAMLDRARRRADVDWVQGDLASTRWEGEFDLIVMTGHAFQVLIGDNELRTALAAIRSALTEEGRFAFETRNPRARAWESWTPDAAEEVTGPTGEVVRVWHEVETPVRGELVRFSTTFEGHGWARSRVSRSTLRFLGADRLGSFLAGAGLPVKEQFGDWDRSPLTATSAEIITLARRAPHPWAVNAVGPAPAPRGAPSRLDSPGSRAR